VLVDSLAYIHTLAKHVDYRRSSGGTNRPILLRVNGKTAHAWAVLPEILHDVRCQFSHDGLGQVHFLGADANADEIKAV
jgi:hypothetical protein